MITRVQKQRKLHRLHLDQLGPKEHQTEETAISALLQDAIKKKNPRLLADRIQHAISFTEDLYPRHIAKIILQASSRLLNMNEHLDTALNGFNLASNRALDPKTERQAAKKAIEAAVKLYQEPKDLIDFINHQYRNFNSPKLKHAFAQLFYQTVFSLDDPLERSKQFRGWVTPIPSDRPYFSNRATIGLIENAPTMPTVQLEMSDYLLAMTKLQDTDSVYLDIAKAGYDLAEKRLKIMEIGKIIKSRPPFLENKRTPALPLTPIFGLNHKHPIITPSPY